MSVLPEQSPVTKPHGDTQHNTQSDAKNSGRQFDYLVFIGRFQPFHNGHKAVVDEALQRARRLIAALGTSAPPKPITLDEQVDDGIRDLQEVVEEEDDGMVGEGDIVLASLVAKV